MVSCRLLVLLFLPTLLATAPPATAQAPEPSRQELLERDGVIWGSAAAWSVPFAENIAENDKIAGLSRLWMEVKINFPNFAQVPDLDWDKTFVDYIPKVRATTSTHEYYRVLQSMVALLHDGHSGVFMPKAVTERQGTPPLRLEVIDHRVFVTAVESPSLDSLGVARGLEIVSIDGTPLPAFVARERAPYVSSNSPQHTEVLRYTYGLLAGDRGVPVSVRFRRPTGTEFTLRLNRSGYAAVTSLPTLEFRQLPGNLAYLAINSFGDPAIEQPLLDAWPAILASDGLIIDVRQNDGGSGLIAYAILGYLSPVAIPLPQWKSREYVPTLRAWGTAGSWYTADKQTAPGQPSAYYGKPVVLLIGPRSLSATDVFAETFRVMERGTLIGEPTGGSTGDPVGFALPGGGFGRVSTSANVGTDLVGRGVQPQLLVPRTVEDFLADRDAALEAAIAELQRQDAHRGE
jgi:carboxyl-terminal processing protease